MELSDKYAPAAIEDKWYEYWIEHDYFHSEPDGRKPYTIVIPPPNVTGVLHMGHMLNNTIQDVLVRRARMLGLNACWVPGTDHASIATEAKVVAKLKAEGIEKNSLTREQFLEHAWQWTDKHGGIILRQLRKLGASCDWARTCFTMDGPRSESVIKVFVDLYNKGKIYRGVRMVNWDPAALTAISDEEVIYKEQHGKLYYLRYMVEGGAEGGGGCPGGGDGGGIKGGAEGGPGYVCVATTRPETILGDTALCVNPADPRYAGLRGKRVIVPLVGRSIPVIFDSYVDIEFGTGALKVTPAHDVNDYMLGEKYGLEAIDIFNDNGTINGKVGIYEGMDRFDLRTQIEKDLAAAGLLEKVEPYLNKVGCSERTGAVIEPKLSMQWFLSMEEISKPALRAVMEETIRLIPPKFKNTYRHWMENVKDWCISRQLWWGHRIPAWYLPEGGFVVAETEEEALELARTRSGNPALTAADLRQDEDVLDTWFSSWLWPISVFDGIRNPDNADIKYYYPTNDLVTAPEILFFWVARMIIAGYEYRGREPFGNVYLTGIVRDKLGRKMSKSLGNSPDPLDLIAQFGADGVRLGMLFTSPAGNDLPYDDSLCEQGRNFGNKIWNAWKLVDSWKIDPLLPQSECNRLAVEWFTAAFDRALAEIEAHFDAYRISDALMSAYKLFWDDFSAWYLEMIKPAYQAPIDAATLAATRAIFERLMQVLHPFMPFLTEELWWRVASRSEGESICISRMPVSKAAAGAGNGTASACEAQAVGPGRDDRLPQPAKAGTGSLDETLLAQMTVVQEVITALRNVRKQKNIPSRETLALQVIADENYHARFDALVVKMAGLSSLERVTEKPASGSGAAAFMVKTTQYFVPLAAAADTAALESLAAAEKAKLQSELEYLEGFLRSVEAKLANERFVGSAPAKVVENERAKQADAQAKIDALRTRLEEL